MVITKLSRARQSYSAFFTLFLPLKALRLTYFQVVATEEIFLRFNGCENMFKVKG